MKSFRFPLQRVLDWRGLQLRTEEEKLAALQQKLAALIHREKALAAAQSRSEAAVLGSPSIEGSDLRALAGFQVRIKSERAALEGQPGAVRHANRGTAQTAVESPQGLPGARAVEGKAA